LKIRIESLDSPVRPASLVSPAQTPVPPRSLPVRLRPLRTLWPNRGVMSLDNLVPHNLPTNCVCIVCHRNDAWPSRQGGREAQIHR
jgi:hypothetical protein